MSVNLDNVTKEELLDFLEELYDVCGEHSEFAYGKEGEVMDKIQALFIQIGLLEF